MLARGAGELDVNTSYAYLLWARDFARTSLIAESGGVATGFVSGYLRPEDPQTLMIWQVAVDPGFRGQGIARRMLHELTDRVGEASAMETTITDDNTASIGLFTRFAGERDAAIDQRELFGRGHFPDAHSAERLYRIAPLH
ncbi:diaminobutyrate acetyltransferase [Flexivirga sp. ID2601S]|uniref:L-2,4-diaminobutyric acid acetyltransferase n=2 Tax=Flexivirga aerilata TaxID=1656889 RepID=A0A849APA5_9MICO|nr:diaminobutyrate acetyltransferase [Flexivirga aerilata]